MNANSADVVVIGGGAAGLAAATSLARFRHRLVLVDAGAPRNAPASGVHNYLSRDGMSPADLLASGRAQLRGYGAQIIDGTVAAVRPALPSGPQPRFTVELADGRRLSARRVLAASGLADVLPQIPGLAERWGRDVLHCPYCHGWEVRDQRIAVLASSTPAVHTAFLWRQLSPDVTLLLQPGVQPGDEQWERLAARGITVVTGPADEVSIDGDRLRGVRLAGGHLVECDAVAISTSLHARAQFLVPLGLRATPFTMGDIVIGSRVEAGPTGVTSVPGVYVAGNVTDLFGQVAGAVSSGLAAAAAINTSLIDEDTDAAVAATRGEIPGPSAAKVPADRGYLL
ncbi:thioredoxin reductase (NADPH) [Actinoplanes lutulentus]|uniref:Thioredoxin reductase n=1 Tax=Actinoplanes lutulentus TaxID=1287878 RepID=A0A327YX14_9ACTN|nr:NAD(P)/FAD-dependent oxidoreductase [Actinoplanes lutulentus]MBB2946414.1 thioredoxin reductase (NADPH) [Actinoplanes lutulentus]RAK25392.1 thioredoxin reductase [Actinoplanes lutulentus]